MTVTVKRKWLYLRLWCPLSLLSFGIKKIASRENDFFTTQITDKSQIKQIIRALKTAKKFHGSLVLVCVKAADGTRVKIKL